MAATGMVIVTMDKHEIVVNTIKQQISLTGVQVKQKIKDVQLELLKELSDEQNGTNESKGFDLH